MNIKKLIESENISAKSIVERLTSGRVPIEGEHLLAMEDFQGIPKGTKVVVDSVETAGDDSPNRTVTVTTEDGASITFTASQADIDMNLQNLFSK